MHCFSESGHFPHCAHTGDDVGDDEEEEEEEEVDSSCGAEVEALDASDRMADGAFAVGADSAISYAMREKSQRQSWCVVQLRRPTPTKCQLM